MYIFGMIILVFFAIIGLCSFTAALFDIACKSGGDSVLQLRDLKADDAEARIRSAARICKSHPDIRLECYCDTDSAAADICALLQKDYPFIEIKKEE